MDLQDLLQRKPRACARLLRLLDDGLAEGHELLKKLYPHTGRAQIIGITGNPGAGKSTLVDQLIEHFRRRGRTVAVVAIDPTSPFSGGAILGDRVRMQRHATDEGVFIRSFATRGHLGGLTSSTVDVVYALDGMGWEVILVETVGVGQDEVDVQRLAHTTLVVMAPGMGDEIQAIKAGILEIADIFVVNKADREGADRTVRELQMLLDMAHVSASELSHHGSAPVVAAAPAPATSPAGWQPQIIKTVAVNGQGIGELMQLLDCHQQYFLEAGRDRDFSRQRLRRQFLEIFQRVLLRHGQEFLERGDRIETLIEKISARRLDPYTAAEEAVRELIGAANGAGRK